MKKQILALGLTFAICITSGCNAELLEAKGKKVELNKKKVTLVKGKSFKLNLKNNKKKVKWCVDKKKIVKLSKKTKKSVLLTAIKIGKAKVTAKVGRKKYVCKVTVSAKGRKNENATQMTENTQNVPQKDQTPKVTKTPTQISNVQETIKPEGSPNVTPKETLIPTAVPTSVPETTKKPVGPTVSVSGSVTDLEGTMLSGVKIGFCRSDYDGDYTAQFSATSDEKGNYTVDGLEKGKNYSARVYVMDNPYSDDWGVNVGTVVAGDTSTYALKVTMALTKVSGILVDAEGDPLMNLQVKLYESAAKRDKDECKTAFSTGEDGAYGQWLEKNKSYFVKICGNGNEYFPGEINTLKVKNDLQIDEALVEVIGQIEDTKGTIYADELISLTFTTPEEKHFYTVYNYKTNSQGQICISMSKNTICNVAMYVDVQTYPIGTMVAGDVSTYDLLLDGALLNVELTLLYANGKEVDEFTIYGEAFDSDTTGYGKFQKTGKNGKCTIRLMEDECWGLKAWVHGMMYDLDEVLLVGDESSYCNRLDVSLMNISGTLETKKGAALAKATVIFYKDIEMQQISGTVVTDDTGVYQIWLDENVIHYAVARIGNIKYPIGEVKKSKNLVVNAELEKVELDIKDFEGNQVKDWYFYKDENGEKGEYLCSKSEGEYLEAGKKYWIDVKFDDSSFVNSINAGAIIVGSPDTYKIRVDNACVTGELKDLADNIVTDYNIVKNVFSYDKKEWVVLNFKNTIDGTLFKCRVNTINAEYSINLVEGQKYNVTVTMDKREYNAGTIVAKRNTKQPITIQTEFEAVHGSVKDSQGDLFAEKHIYFYENEDDSDYCPVASGFINSNGEYGLYLETGKTYYVKIYKYENYKEIYLPAGSITISGQGKYDLRASN